MKDDKTYIFDCFEFDNSIGNLAEVEKEYRRGYAQGAWQAYYAMRDGNTLSRIQKWCLSVQRWREKACSWSMGDKIKISSAFFPPERPRLPEKDKLKKGSREVKA